MPGMVPEFVQLLDQISNHSITELFSHLEYLRNKYLTTLQTRSFTQASLLRKSSSGAAFATRPWSPGFQFVQVTTRGLWSWCSRSSVGTAPHDTETKSYKLLRPGGGQCGEFFLTENHIRSPMGTIDTIACKFSSLCTGWNKKYTFIGQKEP